MATVILEDYLTRTGNKNANVCEDFYAYSCGNSKKFYATTLPNTLENKIITNLIDTLKEPLKKNEVFIKTNFINNLTS